MPPCARDNRAALLAMDGLTNRRSMLTLSPEVCGRLIELKILSARCARVSSGGGLLWEGALAFCVNIPLQEFRCIINARHDENVSWHEGHWSVVDDELSAMVDWYFFIIMKTVWPEWNWAEKIIILYYLGPIIYELVSMQGRNGAKKKCWRQKMRSQKGEGVAVHVTGTKYTYITRNQ